MNDEEIKKEIATIDAVSLVKYIANFNIDFVDKEFMLEVIYERAKEIATRL